MARTIREAIDAGVAALQAMQAADGSFPLWHRPPSGTWKPANALFSTAGVLLAAGTFLEAKFVDLATRYIAGRRRADGLWEFDPKLGIPPDSDSTSCCLAALARFGSRQKLGDGASLLRSFWRPKDGPFRTWRGEGMWMKRDRDDAIINCNIVHALRNLGKEPSPLELSAVERFVRSAGRSRYYGPRTVIGYAAIRAGLPEEALPAITVRRPQPQRLLAAIHWIMSPCRPDNELIGSILTAQQEDGSWPVRAWCTGVSAGDWGSPAVTTALAVEALSKVEGSARAA